MFENTEHDPFQYQYGFKKDFSAQHYLIAMIEKWKKSFDDKGNFGALLKDFSKAFDDIPHELLIAKLSAYGFDSKVLKFISKNIANASNSFFINIALSLSKTIPKFEKKLKNSIACMSLRKCVRIVKYFPGYLSTVNALVVSAFTSMFQF